MLLIGKTEFKMGGGGDEFRSQKQPGKHKKTSTTTTNTINTILRKITESIASMKQDQTMKVTF